MPPTQADLHAQLLRWLATMPGASDLKRHSAAATLLGVHKTVIWKYATGQHKIPPPVGLAIQWLEHRATLGTPTPPADTDSTA